MDTGSNAVQVRVNLFQKGICCDGSWVLLLVSSTAIYWWIVSLVIPGKSDLPTTSEFVFDFIQNRNLWPNQGQKQEYTVLGVFSFQKKRLSCGFVSNVTGRKNQLEERSPASTRGAKNVPTLIWHFLLDLHGMVCWLTNSRLRLCIVRACMRRKSSVLVYLVKLFDQFRLL